MSFEKGAIMDKDENIITDEIRTGYMMNDKVLRPSLVIISKKKYNQKEVGNSN